MKFFVWTYVCKIEENYLYRSLRSKQFQSRKNNESKQEIKEKNLQQNNKNKKKSIECKIK